MFRSSKSCQIRTNAERNARSSRKRRRLCGVSVLTPRSSSNSSSSNTRTRPALPCPPRLSHSSSPPSPERRSPQARTAPRYQRPTPPRRLLSAPTCLRHSSINFPVLPPRSRGPFQPNLTCSETTRNPQTQTHPSLTTICPGTLTRTAISIISSNSSSNNNNNSSSSQPHHPPEINLQARKWR